MVAKQSDLNNVNKKKVSQNRMECKMKELLHLAPGIREFSARVIGKAELIQKASQVSSNELFTEGLTQINELTPQAVFLNSAWVRVEIATPEHGGVLR